MIERKIICAESYEDAEFYALDVEGLADDEWDWCSDCTDKAFRNYPEMEE